MLMDENQKLWQKAKILIPGGNSLLSKRPDMFLPNGWPTYFQFAKGCTIGDLNGNEYKDVSIMGIGTNLLGYGKEVVDRAVIAAVTNGNMSTLNPPEEVELAERLVALHPWADMARFARTGGEANAIAVRIARAASGKSQVAICGYHGWHDWYLAVNLGGNDALEKHLLPGLEPIGVPSNLNGLTVSFNHNDIASFNRVMGDDVGVVIMEVQRSNPPTQNFLEHVRKITLEKGIVLIFDECTSGFRETEAGLHLKYGVFPDIAMYGKALGNGYAITSLVGTRAVMEFAQTSFISSTFWTERIGFVAANATLRAMENERSWEKVSSLGKKIKTTWEAIAQQNKVEISISGLDAIPSFSFEHNHLASKTYLTQEMLQFGFLASNVVFCSTAHDDATIDRYLDCLNSVFFQIGKMQDYDELVGALKYDICNDTFKRLN